MPSIENNYGNDHVSALEVIAKLSREVSHVPDQGYLRPSLIDVAMVARQELPVIQKRLDQTLESYRQGAVIKSHPFSPAAMAYRFGRSIGLTSSVGLDEVYDLQSRCFDRLIDVIDALVVEIGFEERQLSKRKDELSAWIDEAGPAIRQAREELRCAGQQTAYGSMIKRVQRDQARRAVRADAGAVDRMEIMYRSRKELLPALETYSLVMEEISQQVLAVKMHAMAAAEFFEITFNPARILDHASEVIPDLMQGFDSMARYHAALDQGIDGCLDKIKVLTRKSLAYGGR